jgi:hypothetical protein
MNKLCIIRDCGNKPTIELSIEKKTFLFCKKHYNIFKNNVYKFKDKKLRVRKRNNKQTICNSCEFFRIDTKTGECKGTSTRRKSCIYKDIFKKKCH